MLDIEAIKARNENRKATSWLYGSAVDIPFGEFNASEETLHPQTIADIDALIAEVRRLQDPLLCGCGMPADAHRAEGGGLFTVEVPAFPHAETTPHGMILQHRTPGDVSGHCRHGLPLHPQGCRSCWEEYRAANVPRGVTV